MKTFIIHYSPLKERREHMELQLKSFNISAEWVTQHDREDLTIEDLEFWKGKLKRSDSPGFPARVSIFKKMIYAWEQIASKHEVGLVLEDDAVLCGDFPAKLNLYINQLPPSWDYLNVGNGSGRMHIPFAPTSKGNVFRRTPEPTKWGGNGVTRGNDCYALKASGARKLLDEINSNDFQIANAVDWWINITARNLEEKNSNEKLHCYWGEPCLSNQGSVTGRFAPSH
jgi:hypothetical protein